MEIKSGYGGEKTKEGRFSQSWKDLGIKECEWETVHGRCREALWKERKTMWVLWFMLNFKLAKSGFFCRLVKILMSAKKANTAATVSQNASICRYHPGIIATVTKPPKKSPDLMFLVWRPIYFSRFPKYSCKGKTNFIFPCRLKGISIC